MSSVLRTLRRIVSRPLRRPTIHLAVSVLLVGATSLVVWNLVTAASEGARRYGVARTVLVASTDLRAGDRVDPHTATLRRIPAGAVPHDALTTTRPATLTDPVFAGQVVVAGDVTVHRSPTAAALDGGRRAVGLPPDRVGIALSKGDVVDVLAPDAGGSMAVVADAAEVLRADAQRVTLSVASDEVAGVAAAITGDVAIVALRPG